METNYQDSIIRRFRSAFPDKTLRAISEETGIQQTRVFRVFNGAEMKLKEYEAFEKVLSKKSLEAPRFELLRKFQKCVSTLGEKEIALIELELNHLLKVDRFINKSFNEIAVMSTAL